MGASCSCQGDKAGDLENEVTVDVSYVTKIFIELLLQRSNPKKQKSKEKIEFDDSTWVKGNCKHLIWLLSYRKCFKKMKIRSSRYSLPIEAIGPESTFQMVPTRMSKQTRLRGLPTGQPMRKSFLKKSMFLKTEPSIEVSG
jgi:hypothetical protein